MNPALVIIPTYNELDNLGPITTAVLAADPRVDILVVDDNSPDGTGRLADELAAREPRIKVLHREKKQGLGRAYLHAFRWALQHVARDVVAPPLGQRLRVRQQYISCALSLGVIDFAVHQRRQNHHRFISHENLPELRVPLVALHAFAAA